MFERNLKMSVFVLFVFAACTTQVANMSLAESREPVQMTVFRSPT